MGVLTALSGAASAQTSRLPRTSDGKPDLQGIWQVRNAADTDLAAAPGVVEGGAIPYQASATAKKRANFARRKSADPVASCFFPGVPRIMYMPHPVQIFQNPGQVAMTFAWSSVHRLINTTGKAPLHEGIESWMGTSTGKWDGDTLVVKVADNNDKTWFDMAGNFHSEALTVTERYTMPDADSIDYQATLEDAKVFTKPWKIHVVLVRQKNLPRIPEFECQAEKEEANGAFERETHTWYPKAGARPAPPEKDATAKSPLPPSGPLSVLQPGTKLRRGADGKPDLNGYYQSDNGTANQGLERHAKIEFTPATRGIVADPPDGMLPYRPWARKEQIDRQQPYRGYDDPTAQCFVAGVPRSMYVPSPMQILQAPGYVVVLHERMSWRVIPLDGRAHMPETSRYWQGDSVGHWEGDTLVVDTTNLNGKTWLNEFGDVVSHAEHVVERFVPVSENKVIYRATVMDPIVYNKPWTIEIPMNREQEELLEVACHEDNGDLQHLKDTRDEYRAKQKKETKAK